MSQHLSQPLTQLLPLSQLTPAVPRPAATLFVAEPPAQYLMQPPLVVDCSTLSGLLFQEDWQLQAASQIEGKTLHAPYLLQIEITSVALKKAKLGAADIVALGLAEFDQMIVRMHDIDPQETYALAQRYKLSAYDAAYLWLAADLKCPLATFDEKLGKAAQTHLSSLP